MYCYGMFDRLKDAIKGDVLYDSLTRMAYASDASAYEIIPRCVVLPKDVDDVINTVKFANSNGIPIIARGGGSGLAGQAIGDGLILDFTRYMNKILSINLEENYVDVQPGIYKGMLDNILKQYGKFIPPDPSSSNFCSVGGMIATNASGSHTVKYGSMIDYVLELDVVLSDGTLLSLKPLKIDAIDDSREGKIAKYILDLLSPNLKLIERKFPKVSKNSCGYRLDRVIVDDTIDIPKLFVGSEGTLGIITRARLRMINIPSKKVLFLLGFKDTSSALDVIKSIIELKPSALELIDKSIIDLARSANNRFLKIISDDINALLFVEFDDDIEEKMDLLLEKMYNNCIVYSSDREEIDKIWAIRKNALAYSMKIRADDKKPVAFMEDPVVEVNKLASLFKSISYVFDEHSLNYIVYGHAGDGNLHIRPLIDLSKASDLEIMKKIAKTMLGYIIDANGSISAEHGDGLARSEFIRDIYGDDIYSLFVKVKRFLDPSNIMNPGKKVSSSEFTNNLRYMPKDKSSILNWSIKQSSICEGITGYARELDYAREVGLCHGCGGCRELNYSTRMCPVYKGLNLEEASCRGRNNILRWLLRLSDEVEKEYYDDNYKNLIYKYCIQCKTCLYECPSNVNVGKIMAEARARYAKVKGLPKGYEYFIDIDRYAELCSRLAPLSNLLLNNRMFRILMEKYTNIDARKRFPKFHRKQFKQLYQEYANGKSYDRYVAFFYDTYINYNEPHLGLKIARILERYGYGLILPNQLSSGLPALLEGAPDKGKKIAEFNIEHLYEYAKKGMPIITFSPSAGLALKMEYLNVIDNHKSRLVAENTFDIHEFLYMLDKDHSLEFAPIDDDIAVHFHCHTLVLGIDKYVTSILSKIPCLDYHVLERGCCGTGGSYSFIKDNYDLSMSIGRALFDAVRKENKVYTTGESCRLQMEEGSQRRIYLTIDLIAESLLKV